MVENDEIVNVTQSTSMGWNAVVISHCDLRKEVLHNTLSWIENCVRKGSRHSQDKEGKVYIYGRRS